jgi:hypothetical protein
VFHFERRPQFLLGAPPLFADRLERQEDSAVGKIGTGNNVFDAV